MLQDVQTSAPFADEYDRGRHCTQRDPLAAYVPATQVLHSLELSTDELPEGQLVHVPWKSGLVPVEE